jgi:CheY-like chemotaxis protein
MSTLHILIVEDDPKSRKLLRDVLGESGYKTSEAENAEDGVRIAKETIPDLILMDIRLPGMSGIDALQVLRKEESTSAIPVIAVTASVMESQKAEAMSAGFDAVQNKPVNIRSLLGLIRKYTAGDPQQETK